MFLIFHIGFWCLRNFLFVMDWKIHYLLTKGTFFNCSCETIPLNFSILNMSFLCQEDHNYWLFRSKLSLVWKHVFCNFEMYPNTWDIKLPYNCRFIDVNSVSKTKHSTNKSKYNNIHTWKKSLRTNTFLLKNVLWQELKILITTSTN